MKLLDDVKRVLHFDRALFHGKRKLLLACLGVMFVPALYSSIYLVSTWDPYARMDQLRVVIVNRDLGAEVRGRKVMIGASVADGLAAKKTFQLEKLDDEAKARELVSSGEIAFAVLIPPTLSETAMRANAQDPARVKVVFSEGNNFMTGTIARRFADELTRNTNEVLNTERWSVVLDTVDSTRTNVEKLKDGVGRLRDGAEQLDEGLQKAKAGATKLAEGTEKAKAGAEKLEDGASKVSDGTTKLTQGVQLGGGLRQIRDGLPPQEKLDQLSGGAKQVADGNAQLSKGLEQLSDGTTKAKNGAGQLKDGTAKVPIVGGKISEGAGKLEKGLEQLEAGAQKAEAGSQKLADGSAKVADGVDQLTKGVAKVGAGVKTMTEKLPADEKLEQLADGSKQVADGTGKLNDGLGQLANGTRKLEGGLDQLSNGASRLSAGLNQLEQALPANIDGLQGDARGLAASVKPELEPLTQVGAYGNSMVPYFLGLSLWVGVVMMGFIFQLRWFPSRVEKVSKLALVLGRLATPLMLVLGQATLLVFALKFVVNANIPSFFVLWLVAMVTSAVFLTVLVMLVGVFGDVGKVIALLFLVFQMGASGGVFPLALTSDVFRAVHPFLPFSWVLRASRAALFGAYDGAWPSALGVLLLFGVFSIAVTALLGRWKFVPRHRFAPLMDV
ncbi:MAG: YhgE/Pip domain-containing protein [Archangium sp.]